MAKEKPYIVYRGKKYVRGFGLMLWKPIYKKMFNKK